MNHVLNALLKDPTPLLDLLRTTGKQLHKRFQTKDFTVRKKPDASPVTTADLEAHALLSRGLQALTPELWVLSEEGTVAPTKLDSPNSPLYWLVDPLDGTVEFVAGRPQFSINLSLMEGLSPILGFIHMPVFQETYWAAKGCGAFWQQNTGVQVRLPSSSLKTDTLRVVTSRGRTPKHLENLRTIFPEMEILPFGSAYKFCFLARGEADVYYRKGFSYLWDVCAGQLLVQEAGGIARICEPFEEIFVPSQNLGLPFQPAFLSFGPHVGVTTQDQITASLGFFYSGEH